MYRDLFLVICLVVALGFSLRAAYYFLRGCLCVQKGDKKYLFYAGQGMRACVITGLVSLVSGYLQRGLWNLSSIILILSVLFFWILSRVFLTAYELDKNKDEPSQDDL